MRRSDGLCPQCGVSRRYPGRSYCAPCATRVRKECQSGYVRKLPPKTLQDYLPAVRMMCQGYQAKHIARAAGVSPRTVKSWLDVAKKHSGCKSLPELAVWAVVNGHFVPAQKTATAREVHA